MKEIVIRNELMGAPPRVTKEKQENQTNAVGRALGASTARSKQIPVDYASRQEPRLLDPSASPKYKQRLHMDRLFNISNKHVEETPPERRQSLVTGANISNKHVQKIPHARRQSLVTEATASIESPPGTIPMEKREDPIIRSLKLEARKAKERERKEVEAIETTTGPPICTMFGMEFSSYADRLCGTPDIYGPQETDRVEILEDPVGGPIPIPREISFSKKKGSGSWSDDYLLLSNTAALESRPPSLLDRIKRKKNDKVLPKLKVYVDRPKLPKSSSEDSIDHSVLTTP